MREAIADELVDSAKIAVVVHTHADLDAIGSAVGLATTVDAEGTIVTPGSVQSAAATLLETCDVTVDSDAHLDAYDLSVVVDAPSQERIAPSDPVAAAPPCAVIDHHDPDDLQTAADLTHIDSSAPATAVLVSQVLEGGGFDVSETAAMALAAGLLDDTGFRAIIGEDTYEPAAKLLEQAGDARSVLPSLWETDVPWSERMATAKALVRANGYKAGQTILLTTTVGGEETAAAHALLAGNADIAITVSPRSDQTRVVARTSDSTDIDLALPEAVLEPLAREFGGDGGGHSGAGVAKLETTDTEAVENRTVLLIGNALGVQFGQFS
ncbi:DHH family phosphoesterase [Halosimplex pelagicum]|uniref:DHH family phosphoesterase n=1 Tax=Halosimplex pelagicum TaxID=869886 RepID=A0A7D5TV51_9EURY|nr:DHH family phosphoesterase [Halosimplex pelagicum]QLH83772.1 DHH family phosphoesterase [Halosimplex pelagicum]